MPSKPNISDNKTLAHLRQEIDGIDGEILRLLHDRLAIAAQLAASKGNASHFRPGREADVLRRLVADNAAPLTPIAIESIWRQIMTASLTTQTQLRVAVVDKEGVFVTARWRFGTSAYLVSCDSINAAFALVTEDKADLAVIPHWQHGDWGFAGAWQKNKDTRLPLWLVAQIPFFSIPANDKANATTNSIPLTPAAIFAHAPPDPSQRDITLVYHQGELHTKDGYDVEEAGDSLCLGVFQKP